MENILNRKKKVAEHCAPLPLVDFVGHNDEVLNLLYEPQANGLPDLSLGLIFAGSVRPEVAQYADKMLLHGSTPNRYATADEAMEFTPINEFQLGREREVFSSQLVNMLKKYSEEHKDLE